MHKLLTGTLTSVGLTMLLATNASAQGPGFCSEYSARAVAMAGENLARGCGYGGARWTVDYNAHYGWCMSAPPRAAMREQALRRDGLAACRRGRY